MRKFAKTPMNFNPTKKKPCELCRRREKQRANPKPQQQKQPAEYASLEEVEVVIRELTDKVLRLREEIRLLRQIDRDDDEEGEEDNENGCRILLGNAARTREPSTEGRGVIVRKRISRGVQYEETRCCEPSYKIRLHCFQRQDDEPASYEKRDGRRGTRSSDKRVDDVAKESSSPRSVKHRPASDETKQQQQQKRSSNNTGSTSISRDGKDKKKKEEKNKSTIRNREEQVAAKTVKDSVTTRVRSHDRSTTTGRTDRSSSEINEGKKRRGNGKVLDVEAGDAGNDLIGLIDKRERRLREKSERLSATTKDDATNWTTVKDSKLDMAAIKRSLFGERKNEAKKQNGKEEVSRKTSLIVLGRTKSSDGEASKNTSDAKLEKSKVKEGSKKLKSSLKDGGIMGFFGAFKEKSKGSDKKTVSIDEKKNKVDDIAKKDKFKLLKQKSNDSQASFIKKKLRRCVSELNVVVRKVSELFRK